MKSLNVDLGKDNISLVFTSWLHNTSASSVNGCENWSSIHGGWHICRMKDIWVFAYISEFPFLLCFSQLSYLCQPCNVFQWKKILLFSFWLIICYCFEQKECVMITKISLSARNRSPPLCLQIWLTVFIFYSNLNKQWLKLRNIKKYRTY